ncbi:hypothetical protein [Enterococcus mundtii]|uniref:hypothetical protein n=1 Tax=Enterococcus mundtii TaxID=53346 RepID=UPI000E063224|nr:hypothetical protein [Enterococcus mundtii]STD26036.1 Uncharacterised protein [Enterococcus mundtii]
MKISNLTVEIFESLKRKKYLLIFYTLFLLFSFLTLSVSDVMLQENSSEEHRVSVGNTKTYKLVDTLIGEKEEVFLRNLQSVSYLNAMYKELSDSQKGEYQVVNSQSINYLQEKDLPTEFIEHYEQIAGSVSSWTKEEIPFKSLQMNDHALERFDLRIASGQSFSPSDYQYNRDKIPVILGNSYSDYYTIGDKIQLSYLFKQFEAEVIGFVEKGERVTFNEYEDYVLDHYIILPFIENAPQKISEEEFSFFQKHFLNGVNGYFQVPESFSQEKVYKLVNEISSTYELGTVDLIGESGFHLSALLFMITKNNELLKLVVSFSMIILVLMTIVFCCLEMYRDKKIYQLHLLFGATKKEIRNYIMVEKTLLLSFILCVSLTLTNYLGGITLVLFIRLLYLSLVLIFLFFLISTIILRKWRITND